MKRSRLVLLHLEVAKKYLGVTYCLVKLLRCAADPVRAA
jgi:hypothetical protein